MSFHVPRRGEVLSRDIADYPGGIVLPVNKPFRWTSADVIRKLKFAAIRHFGKKNLKVGHAGTLDPLATGVLLVCVGPACKMAQTLQDHDKEYIADIRFGATTPSYDLEKEVAMNWPGNCIVPDGLMPSMPRRWRRCTAAGSGWPNWNCWISRKGRTKGRGAVRNFRPPPLHRGFI